MTDVMTVQLAISKLHMRSLLEQPLSESVAMQALAGLNTALAELEATNDELTTQIQELATVTHAHEAETRRYRELFERVPVPYIVTDEWGVVDESNRAAEELLNVDKELLRAKPISVFVPPDARREFRDRINKLPQASVWEVVFHPRGRDRITVQIEVAKIPSENEWQARLGWVIQNTTPQLAAAAAEKMLARETTMRLEAQAAILRLRALQVGLQTMAHDTDQPVRARITSLLEVLVPRFAQSFLCYLPTEPDEPIKVGDQSQLTHVLQTVVLGPNRDPGRLIARRATPFYPEDGALLQSAANAISLLLFTS